MDINGWNIKNNTFTKSFDKYQVEIKEVQPKHINESIRVTIRFYSNENNKTALYYDNFEEAFDFVDDFVNQKPFDRILEWEFNNWKFYLTTM